MRRRQSGPPCCHFEGAKALDGVLEPSGVALGEPAAILPLHRERDEAALRAAEAPGCERRRLVLAGLYYDQCYGCFLCVPILWQYCLVLAGGRRRIGYVGVAAHLARHLSLASLQVFTPLIGHEPSRPDRHEPSADASAQYPVTTPCGMPHHGAE